MDPIAPNIDRLDRRCMINMDGKTSAIFRNKYLQLKHL